VGRLLKEARCQYPLKHGPVGPTEDPHRHLGASAGCAGVAVVQETPFHSFTEPVTDRAGDEGIDHAWVDNAIRPLAYEGHALGNPWSIFG
jgi:hypothetical protein